MKDRFTCSGEVASYHLKIVIENWCKVTDKRSVLVAVCALTCTLLASCSPLETIVANPKIEDTRRYTPLSTEDLPMGWSVRQALIFDSLCDEAWLASSGQQRFWEAVSPEAGKWLHVRQAEFIGTTVFGEVKYEIEKCSGYVEKFIIPAIGGTSIPERRGSVTWRVEQVSTGQSLGSNWTAYRIVKTTQYEKGNIFLYTHYAVIVDLGESAVITESVDYLQEADSLNLLDIAVSVARQSIQQ